jgi:predicted GNAT family N-acyltransferase
MKHSFKISSEAPGAVELLHLFKQADWARHRSLADTEKLMPRVDVFIVIRDEGRLIGYGRALCDGVFRAILDDIIVDEEYRGGGVGRLIVEGLMQQLDGIEEVLLHTEQHLEGFYKRFGFENFHGLTMNIKAIE